jgi:hypothetical protein
MNLVLLNLVRLKHWFGHGFLRICGRQLVVAQFGVGFLAVLD